MSASAKADQALAVPVEPASGLAPPGFDPSRDDMVFRVAKAIARSNVLAAEPKTGRLSGAGIDQLVEYFSTKCIPEARAAIAAMREPTEAMLAEGRRFSCCGNSKACAWDGWQTMIDAAIATEAGTAETTEIGSVHEGAGRNGIAQTPPVQP